MPRSRFVVLLGLALAGCGGGPSPTDDTGGMDGGAAADAAGPGDGGAADTAARTDAGPCTGCDAGEPDAGDLDAGELDAGELDAGELDAGELDAGDLDAGVLDAGDLDAGEPDGGELVDAPVGCTYEIAPAARTITNACGASSGTLTVTVTSGCPWAAVVDLGGGPTGWLRVTSGGGPTAGTGVGQTVTYAVASNRHADARAGTITVVDASSAPTGAVTTLGQAHGHACP